MDRRFDPRSIVTPYAFAVHPDLLGTPLATPWQRFGAIVIDLIVIGFISQVGVAPLAIASTALLLWLAFRKPGRDGVGKVFRIAVGCLGFLILSVTLFVAVWMRYGDDIQRALEKSDSGIQINATGALAGDEEASGSQEEDAQVGILDIVQGFRGVAALQGADNEEEAQVLLNDLAKGALDAGVARSEIREILGGFIPENADWSQDAPVMVDRAMETLSAPNQEAPERAPPSGDEGIAEAPEAFSPAAVDSLGRLEAAVRRAEEEQADLQESLERAQAALEAEEDQGLLSWLWGLIDDLGIGFGWAALYLTVAHAWWRGKSIGKMLFRIRVVMIDKRPLTWWLSFERAGGYAAGLATGLLGFAQVFWDPNRQAIHDKVSETIVIQEGKAPVPGPWIEEGKAQWSQGRHGENETPGA
jgi:hypothetical protein